MDPATAIGTAIGVAMGLAIPGTIAVFKIVPSLVSKTNGTGNGNGDAKVYDTVRRAIDDRLAPIFQRQTTILEHMQQTLTDNTLALQIFMKLEEQRERLGRGSPGGSMQG